jgi:hypothetical protein
MVYRSQREPVVPRRGTAINRGLAAVRSPGNNNGPAKPKPAAVRHFRSVSTPDVGARPIRPAEAAQARLFEKILRAEIAEMVHLPPEAREQLRDRIQQADGLIKALRDRFPHGPTVTTPPAAGLQSPENRAPRSFPH